jgi:hypothetical protein
MNKSDYVRSRMSTPAEGHTCHWLGCEKKVPPALWGCKKHWYTLPIALRQKVWETFEPGQEISKDPSMKYFEVMKEVNEWIRAYLDSGNQEGAPHP